MILRLPDYYKEFHCIADKCKDSCCVGWEIDIDEDTYEYYHQVEGEFGDRLRTEIRKGKDTSFRLHKGRCPFLNKQNLCDIVTELGETALCEICTEYPRFTLEYNDVKEKCLGLSCEEAGRIIFSKKEPIQIEEVVLEEEYTGLSQQDYFEGEDEKSVKEVMTFENKMILENEMSSKGEMTSEDKLEEKLEEQLEDELEEVLEDELVDEEELDSDYTSDFDYECEQDYYEEDVPSQLADGLELARNHCIRIMQDRSMEMVDRWIGVYLFSEQVQDAINEDQLNKISDTIHTYSLEHLPELIQMEKIQITEQLIAERKKSILLKSTGKSSVHPNKIESMMTPLTLHQERMRVYQTLEVLDEEWSIAYKLVQECFNEENLNQLNLSYEEFHKEFTKKYQEREYELEHLAVYFLFRYVLKSVYDCDFLGKVKFGMASYLMIRDLDVERWIRNGRSYSREDRIDTARIYSKEVEHSEDNLELMADALVYETVFQKEQLLRQILYV